MLGNDLRCVVLCWHLFILKKEFVGWSSLVIRFKCDGDTHPNLISPLRGLFKALKERNILTKGFALRCYT